MKVLIVEDNKNHADYLHRCLAQQNIYALPPVNSVRLAIEAIEEERPRVVILDYEIVGGYGPEVVEHFYLKLLQEGRSKSELGFYYLYLTDKKDEFSGKAIDISGQTHCLGAYLKTDINVAIEHIIEKMEHFQKTILAEEDVPIIQLKGLYEKQQERLLLKNDNDCFVLPLSEVVYLEGDGAYTKLYLTEKSGHESPVQASKPLGKYEEALKQRYFIRISRSHVVNLAFVSRFNNRNTSQVSLRSSKESLPVGSKYEHNLKQALGIINV